MVYIRCYHGGNVFLAREAASVSAGRGISILEDCLNVAEGKSPGGKKSAGAGCRVIRCRHWLIFSRVGPQTGNLGRRKRLRLPAPPIVEVSGATQKRILPKSRQKPRSPGVFGTSENPGCIPATRWRLSPASRPQNRPISAEIRAAEIALRRFPLLCRTPLTIGSANL